MSETESQGRNSKVDEDGSAIPAIITDEYFDEITSKCEAVSVQNNNCRMCSNKLRYIFDDDLLTSIGK